MPAMTIASVWPTRGSEQPGEHRLAHADAAWREHRGHPDEPAERERRREVDDVACRNREERAGRQPEGEAVSDPYRDVEQRSTGRRGAKCSGEIVGCKRDEATDGAGERGREPAPERSSRGAARPRARGSTTSGIATAPGSTNSPTAAAAAADAPTSTPSETIVSRAPRRPATSRARRDPRTARRSPGTYFPSWLWRKMRVESRGYGRTDPPKDDRPHRAVGDDGEE